MPSHAEDLGISRTLMLSADHPSVRQDYVEEHGIEPRLREQILPLAGLLLVVLGDFASFNLAISRSFATMAPWLTFLLTAAMTAVAVLLMLEAGRAEARRRGRNSGSVGKGPIRLRVLAWLFVGATAFVLRLAAPVEAATGSGGFGSGGGFGSSPSSAAAELMLGPLSLHGENLVSALTLLAIFVAGGVGAFYYGRESYNPRMLELQRASAQAGKARRALGSAQRAQAAAATRAQGIASATEHHGEARRRLVLLEELEHELSLYETTVVRRRELEQQVMEAETSRSTDRVALDSLTDRARTECTEVQHSGEEAKRRARLLIAAYRGEPGATSGLTNGARP